MSARDQNHQTETARGRRDDHTDAAAGLETPAAARRGPRSALRVAALAGVMTVTVDGASLSLLSRTPAGLPGDGDSGYQALPSWYGLGPFERPWQRCGVNAEGTVALVSLATTIGESAQTGPETGYWDVFGCEPGAGVTTVSVARPGERDAREVVTCSHGDTRLVVYVRDLYSGAAGEHPQQLAYLVPQTEARPRAIPVGGCDQFRHLSLTSENGSAVLVFSAREGSTGRFDVYRVGLAYVPASPEDWLVTSGPTLTAAGPEGDAVYPTISLDGRVVAYASNGDVFVQREGGVAENITSGVSSWCTEPVLSQDGRHLYFTCMEGTKHRLRVYHSSTKSVSAPLDDAAMLGDVSSPATSRDGSFVTFSYSSAATGDWFAPAGNTTRQVYLLHADTGQVECLSVNAMGETADGDCETPAISADGRYVVFASRAGNLTAEGGNGRYQVFQADRGSGSALSHPPRLRTWRVARKPGQSQIKVYVDATDQESGLQGVECHLAVPPTRGTLTHESGAELATWFAANASPLVYRPTTASATTPDSFVLLVRNQNGTVASGLVTMVTRDLSVGIAEWLTDPTNDPELELDQDSPTTDSDALAMDKLAMDSTGKWVAFTRFRKVLTMGRWVPHKAIYLRNRQTGRSHLLAMTAESGNPVAMMPVALAGGGDAIAFAVDGKVYRCPLGDTMACLDSALSRDAPNVRSLSLSADGRWLVCDHGPEGAGSMDKTVSIWREGGGRSEKTAVATHLGVWPIPVISADGTVVALRPAAGTLRLLFADPVTGFASPRSTEITETDTIYESSVSRNGAFLAYQVGKTVKLLSYQQSAPASILTVSPASLPSVAAEGDFLYLVANPAEAEGTSGPEQQAYRYSLGTGTYQLLSRTGSGTAGVGACSRGTMTPEAGTVAFASVATLAGDTTGKRDVFCSWLGQRGGSALPSAKNTQLSAREDVPLDIVLTTNPATTTRDLRFRVTQSPTHGTVVHRFAPGSRCVSYTPDPNYHGTDSFRFVCQDDFGASNEATVTLSIAAVYDGPQWNARYGTAGGVVLVERGARVDLLDYVGIASPDDPLDASWASLQLRAVGGMPPGVSVEPDGRHLLWAGNGWGSGEFSFAVKDTKHASTPGAESVARFRLATLVHLARGWRLVSLPATPSASFSQEFSNAAAGTVWSWQWANWDRQEYASVPLTGGRAPGTSSGLRPGVGYWVYRDGDPVHLEFSSDGLPGAAEKRVLLRPRWNLVGPVGVGDTCPAPLSPVSTWAYEADSAICRRLAEPGSLHRADGYWMYSPFPDFAWFDLDLDASGK